MNNGLSYISNKASVKLQNNHLFIYHKYKTSNFIKSFLTEAYLEYSRFIELILVLMCFMIP
jgi:hypothetical protein